MPVHYLSPVVLRVSAHLLPPPLSPSQVALDLLDPGPLVSHLVPVLKPGGLLSVYLPK